MKEGLSITCNPELHEACNRAVRPFGCVLAIGGLLLAGSVRADVSASDPATVLSEMRDAGFPATMHVDSNGDPLIKSKVSRSNFGVYFYGCNDDGKHCSSIQFGAGYRMSEGLNNSVASDWNRTKRLGKAYVDDDGNPHLKMDINLVGGISADNFEANLEWWRVAIDRFENHIGNYVDRRSFDSN